MVRYAFDDANRLMIRERDGATGRLRPVRIVEGTATTDRGNRLVYRVDTTDASTPRRYNLDGTWSLTRHHELKLALHRTTRGRRQILYLRGTLIEAKAHALTVALQQYGMDGRRTAQRLSLRGRWQADARNRLTFLVEKADGSADRLTLRSGWTLDTRHTLLYQYRTPRGPRQNRSTLHTVRFAGWWDIPRAGRLVYRLDGSTDSAFEFRATLQRPSLNAREGRIVYQVGVELSRRPARQQRVVLFGKWKFHRDLSVSFEIPYAQGRRTAIRFTTTYVITEKDELAVRLSDRRGRPLGLSVTFSRRRLDDAQLFLTLRKAGGETEVLGGVQVQF